MIRVTDKQFWMHPILKNNLDTLIHNTRKDMSFCIVVSGDSSVRVGKSTIAQQIGYYVAYNLGRPFTADNVVFGSENLMREALAKSPGVFQVDETRDDLNSAQVLTKKVQDLITFMSETGKKNNVIIFVLPDFFDLPKSVAMGLSEYLVNCFISKKKAIDKNGAEVLDYNRGYFGFYGRDRKKILYLKGKKEMNYGAVGYNFWGSFVDTWVIDEKEYNSKKDAYIARSRQIKPSARSQKWLDQRNKLIKWILDNKYAKPAEINRIANAGQDMVYDSFSRENRESGGDSLYIEPETPPCETNKNQEIV